VAGEEEEEEELGVVPELAVVPEVADLAAVALVAEEPEPVQAMELELVLVRLQGRALARV
jgi:hypothetical protein